MVDGPDNKQELIQYLKDKINFNKNDFNIPGKINKNG